MTNIQKKFSLQKRDVPYKEMTFDNHDRLGREKIARTFSELFSNTNKSFVVGLDSPWGTGKTQFIYMWRNLLDKNDKKSVYINLWEEDFLKSPFFSLVNALFELFEENKIGESANVREWKRVGIELSRALVNKVLNVDIKKLMEEDFEKKQRDKKDNFKEQLGKLAKIIKDKNKFPLIIFIDEIDRCRPDYAVEFLEIVKHFFEIDNIIFVLGIDMGQLQHSVRSLYGEGMNAEEYLRKFIDMRYKFPESDKDSYIDFLFSEFECNSNNDIYVNLAKKIIKKFNPTMRQIDNFFSRFKVAETQSGLDYVQLVFLLSLKTFREDYYKKLESKSLKLGEIVSMLDYFEDKEYNLYGICFWIFANNIIMRQEKNLVEYKDKLNQFKTKLNDRGFNAKSKALFPSGFIITSKIGIYNTLKNFETDGDSYKVEWSSKFAEDVYRNKDTYLEDFNRMFSRVEFFEHIEFSKGKEDVDDDSK